MNIYSVKILFRYSIEESPRALYEESTRLFHAESFEDAHSMAVRMAMREEYEYFNVYARKVRISFYAIADDFWLFDNLDFVDGTEVFSSHFEMKNPDDDPLEMRFNRCSLEDMYILRQAQFNGLWIDDTEGQ